MAGSPMMVVSVPAVLDKPYGAKTSPVWPLMCSRLIWSTVAVFFVALKMML